jgi:phenylalanyl-tRNA synthetase beta subunit
MKVSYNKLQTFFDQPLPKVEDLAQGIIFHAFEVEELINSGEDTILDLKVLPDRTFDCADEFGIAKEVSAIFKLPLKTEFEVVSTGGTREVTVSLQLINERLGVEVPEGVVVEILTSLNLKPQVGSGVVTCVVPATRPDIVLPENLIKEVGRIYGYDKIVVTNLPETDRVTDADNFLRTQIVRAKLVELGFTEIYGYSFAETGDLQVLKPLQQDKPFLRTT